MPADQNFSHPFAQGLALGAITGLTASLILLLVAYYFDWDRALAIVHIVID